MYEWAKGSAPTGATASPTATEPIAPPDHPVLPLGDDTATGYKPVAGYEADLSQAEVDKLDPIQRALRGLGHVHQALFDKDNGGNVLTAAGDALTIVGAPVVKPVEIGATALSHIPLGGVTGADTAFQQVGDYMKQHDPSAYQNWLAVKAKADADVLGGGNLRGDFVGEAAKYYDKFNREGTLGSNPHLTIGAQGTGSLGGVLSHFLQGVWGAGAANVQGFLGNAGVFDPGKSGVKTIQEAVADSAAGRGLSDDAAYAVKQFQSGAMTATEANDYIAKNAFGGRSRIQESIARFQRGGETSDLEQEAAKNVISGKWSEKHANDYLIAGGQSITRNPVGQIVVGLATDPTMLAMGGAGVLAKAAKIGTEALEVGGAAAKAFEAADSLTGAAKAAKLAEAEQLTQAAHAETTYQQLSQTLARVTTNPVLGPIAKAGRSIIDPFQLLPVSSVTRGLKDLFNGASVDAFGSAYGHASVAEVRGLGREAGLGQEVDTALASISQDRGSELMAIEERDNALRNELGNELVHSPVDVSAAVKAAPRDVVVRLSDYITRVRKTIFTPEDIAALAGRTAKSLGGDSKQWFERISKMSRDTVSTLHTLTAKMAETDFVESALNKIDKPNYTGDLPLPELTLLNPENIDNVTAQALLDEQTGLVDSIKGGADAWNKAGLRYPEIAQIGHATGNKDQLAELVAELKSDLEQGQFHRRVLDDELTHPSLAPIVDFLDRHTINGQRLWNVGFRPAEDVSWGLKADRATGKWIAGRTPSINRVIDAVYNQGFSDTTRNILGQIIPDARIAGKINAPIDAMEAFAKTATDVVSGRRLVMNIEQRFNVNMAERLGVPSAISKDVWKAVSDVAALNRTTVRGLPLNDSVWLAIEKVLPADLVQSGKLNVRNVMGALLDAAEGDLRIMGVTSKMTQRMRNQIMRAVPGFQGNALGELTVTQYNRFRYIQPTFLIQKVTDAPYFMALHGIMPVGTGELTPALAAVRRIEENMGFTGTARDFAMDYPERALHSNWVEGIGNRLKGIVNGDLGKIDRIQGTFDSLAGPIDSKVDRYVANNMTKDLSTRMGSIVRESLDEIDNLLKLHPDLATELQAARSQLRMTMADWRAEYSRLAGRVLSDDEAGLKFVQEQMASARRVKAIKGGIDTEAFHHEMTLNMPTDFGEVHTIYPEQLAAEMGFGDARELREAIAGKFNPQTQQIEKGILGIDRFKEDLKNEFGANQAYIDRASRYFGDTWEGYFNGLSRPVEQGGLDLSARSLRDAQDMIRVWAKDRGMDPWEYLSQVVGTNLGAEGLDTHIQKLAQFLAKGPEAAITPEDVMGLFKGHLDQSAQRTLVDEYLKTGAEKPSLAGTFEAVHPAQHQEFGGLGADEFARQELTTDATFGPGFRALSHEEQAPLVTELARFHESFPGIHIKHLDVQPIGEVIPSAANTTAATLGDAERSAIFLDAGHFSGPDTATKWAKMTPGFTFDQTRAGVLRHELFHNLDDQLPILGPWGDFREKFIKAIDSGDLDIAKAGSEYSTDARTIIDNGDGAVFSPADKHEAIAELGSLAFSPTAKVPAVMEPWVREMRTALRDQGAFVAPVKPSSGFNEGRSIAQAYNDKQGFGTIATGRFEPANPDFGKRTAAAYDAMPVMDPAAKPAYEALAKEIDQQYKALTDAGIKVEPVTSDPYKNSAEMIADVRDNKRLKVYASDLSHPFLTDEQNLRFRAVHDLFGHSVEGYQFGPRGEFNASLKHAQMFSDQARPAMLTETHGQNSWVNYGPNSGLPAAERPFATQKAALLPQDILDEFNGMLKTDTGLDAAATAAKTTDQFFAETLPNLIRQRAESGVAHANSEIEGFFQHFSKWAQSALQGGQTRNELRSLVESIPTGHASPFNRFEFLMQQVLHDKIRLAQSDVFMLAEMATNRNVLMRSINHPFFGIYPASYMWGKVLPATAKALAKNPYGLTYGINEVQRTIATQREYDPQASIPEGVDKSSVAFLLGYLTPSLPWETMQAQTPPWARDIQKGVVDPFKIAGDELHTMSPERWYSFFQKPAKEVIDAAQGAFQPQQPDDTDRLQSIVTQQTGSAAPSTPQALSGPTKATGLSPILASEMEQLQRVLSGH